jgi:hypothetical protein
MAGAEDVDVEAFAGLSQHEGELTGAEDADAGTAFGHFEIPSAAKAAWLVAVEWTG